MVDLATGRYQTFRPELGVPVRTTVGTPRFPLRYELDEFVRQLAPWGLFGKELSDDEFTVLYRERLEKIGVDVLRAEFEAIAARNDGKRLVLLCFEDVLAGQPCHRRTFAAWWAERTGQVVPELEPGASGQNTLQAPSGRRPGRRP
jgi:hypothetical protein